MRRRGRVLDTLLDLGFGPERPVPNTSAIARAVGADRTNVFHWLTGDTVPSLENARRLAAALEVSLDKLAQALQNARDRDAHREDVQSLIRRT